MKKIDVGQVITILANIGVLVGLILVALQIRQNTVLVRAELVSNATDSWIDIDASKQSDNFASVLAKSIDDPQELTSAEIIELDGYLYTYLDQLLRDRQLHELGVFDVPSEDLIQMSIMDYFGNEFARAWWAETKSQWPPDIIDLVDREMETVSVNQDLEKIERIRRRLKD